MENCLMKPYGYSEYEGNKYQDLVCIYEYFVKVTKYDICLGRGFTYLQPRFTKAAMSGFSSNCDLSCGPAVSSLLASHSQNNKRSLYADANLPIKFFRC